ncbi:MAG: MOSC domain-containing protein, partial [Streptosporangiaceae bacterium]
DGSADPQRQVTVMNARVAELVAGRTDRMPLAGDQLYVDLDISVDNLPAGSLLAVGEAVLEVSDAPHLGCAKFVERFGADAMRFVNSRVGRRLRLRGMNTTVVQPGTIRPGDLASTSPAVAPLR